MLKMGVLGLIRLLLEHPWWAFLGLYWWGPLGPLFGWGISGAIVRPKNAAIRRETARIHIIIILFIISHEYWRHCVRHLEGSEGTC